jgi:hypothetical protein
VRGRPFAKGADERRHVHTETCGHRLYQFSTADRSRGFWNAHESLTVRYGDDRARTLLRWATAKKGGAR